MRRRAHTNRGMMLVQLMLVLVIASLVLWMLGKILIDSAYLQHVAAQHADRARTTAALTRQLRRDASSASDARWLRTKDAVTLEMQTYANGRAVGVRYTITRTSVRRERAGVQTHVWQTARLAFDADVQRGPHGVVLRLSILEQPPPRTAHLPNRRLELTVMLPARTDIQAPPDGE